MVFLCLRVSEAGDSCGGEDEEAGEGVAGAALARHDAVLVSGRLQ